MSSLFTEARRRSEASLEMKYKIRRTFTHLNLQACGYVFGHCDERCVACPALQLELRIDVCQCSVIPYVQITYVFQILRPTSEVISHSLQGSR